MRSARGRRVPPLPAPPPEAHPPFGVSPLAPPSDAIRPLIVIVPLAASSKPPPPPPPPPPEQFCALLDEPPPPPPAPPTSGSSSGTPTNVALLPLLSAGDPVP